MNDEVKSENPASFLYQRRRVLLTALGGSLGAVMGQSFDRVQGRGIGPFATDPSVWDGLRLAAGFLPGCLFAMLGGTLGGFSFDERFFGYDRGSGAIAWGVFGSMGGAITGWLIGGDTAGQEGAMVGGLLGACLGSASRPEVAIGMLIWACISILIMGVLGLIGTMVFGETLGYSLIVIFATWVAVSLIVAEGENTPSAHSMRRNAGRWDKVVRRGWWVLQGGLILLALAWWCSIYGKQGHRFDFPAISIERLAVFDQHNISFAVICPDIDHQERGLPPVAVVDLQSGGYFHPTALPGQISLCGELSQNLSLLVGGAESERNDEAKTDEASQHKGFLEYGKHLFEGLASPVRCASVSHDGRILVSGGSDGIRLWDASIGKEKDHFPLGYGHRGTVTCVAFASDDQRMLTGGVDRTVAVWDVQARRRLFRLVGHTDTVNRGVFSPDGRRILTAGADMTIRLWDGVTGEEIWRFLGHTDKVTDVAVSRDGRRILSSSDDGTIRLWEVPDETLISASAGCELNCFRGHWGAVKGVAFTSNDHYAVSGGHDGTLRLWKLPTR